MLLLLPVEPSALLLPLSVLLQVLLSPGPPAQLLLLPLLTVGVPSMLSSIDPGEVLTWPSAESLAVQGRY